MQKEPTDKQVKTLSARQQTWQMLKFTLFSISAGGIQFLSFTLMNEVFRFPTGWGMVPRWC